MGLGFVFGFFTSIPWTTPSREDVRHIDSTAYIFSITKQTVHHQNPNIKCDMAIRHWHTKAVFRMGRGIDLMIDENFNESKNNTANLGGGTYRRPDVLDSCTYLGGTFSFKVTDIEVYEADF